jgi:YesN/AraC family two-component response regulator
MVCLRCRLFVKKALTGIGLHPVSVGLGIVETEHDLTPEQCHKLDQELTSVGLGLIRDKQAILVERIKNIIVETVHYNSEIPDVNFSVYLSNALDHDYNYLSNIFSQIQGCTIQQYMIRHRIERAKRLLIEEDISVKEIAYKLHYNSIAHLSNQFKRVVGVTPSQYKKQQSIDFIPLENI